MLRWITAVLGAAFVAFHAAPGGAQTVCGERAEMLAYFLANYSEQPVAMALTEAGSVVEVLTSSKGTWTILVTIPAGLTCVVNSGVSWEALPVPAIGRIS